MNCRVPRLVGVSPFRLTLEVTGCQPPIQILKTHVFTRMDFHRRVVTRPQIHFPTHSFKRQTLMRMHLPINLLIIMDFKLRRKSIPFFILNK